MYVRAASCADGTGSGTSAPTGAPAAVSGGLSLLGKRMGSMMTCFTTFAAGSALAGASPLVAGGFGAVMAGLSNGLPMAQAQDTSCVDEIIVEIHGPTMGDEDMAAKIAELEAANAELQAQLEGSVSAEMAVDMQFDLLVQEIAFDDYVRTTPKKDQSLSRLLNSNSAQYYNKAGLPILERHNPEPAFYLKNADDDSLLRDMQGDVFQLPTTSNTFDEVLFSLPDPPAYSEPSDLYYMPILQIASLLRSGAVDCVTIVQAFIDRLQEFDPYLAIVITPLYERALGTAASHDQLLANGTDTGALMCIPFGLKDHHQVYDDEPTTCKLRVLLKSTLLGVDFIRLRKTSFLASFLSPLLVFDAFFQTVISFTRTMCTLSRVHSCRSSWKRVLFPSPRWFLEHLPVDPSVLGDSACRVCIILLRGQIFKDIVIERQILNFFSFYVGSLHER